MVLLLHIVTALASLACTGYALAAPSKRRLQACYMLVALTLATGSYLVVGTHAALVPSCISGLLYLAVACAGIFGAHYRLARAAR